MAATGMMGNIADFFNNPKYSDITVHFGAYDVPAHKIVLAKSSDYFRVSFDSDFKEAFEDIIELKDDDPSAMFGVLAHVYGLNYDGRNGYTKDKDRTKVPCDATGAAYVQYQVTLYVTASKYLVPTLCTQIADEFGQLLGCIVVDGGHSGYLAEVVRHVYVTHAEAAVDLRAPIVRLFQSCANLWITDEWCRQICLEVPELTLDLATALTGVDIAVAQPTTQAGERTAASMRSKRKRG